jgi:hypothetical protein
MPRLKDDPLRFWLFGENARESTRQPIRQLFGHVGNRGRVSLGMRNVEPAVDGGGCKGRFSN